MSRKFTKGTLKLFLIITPFVWLVQWQIDSDISKYTANGALNRDCYCLQFYEKDDKDKTIHRLCPFYKHEHLIRRYGNTIETFKIRVCK